MPIVECENGVQYCIINEGYIERMPRLGNKRYLTIDEVPEIDRKIVQDHLNRTIRLEEGHIVVNRIDSIEYWGFGEPPETFDSVDGIPSEHKKLVKEKLKDLGYSD